MYPHLHKFKLECDSMNNHKHILSGYTEGMIGINAFHFHFFWGISSYKGHTHYFSGVSGLPVKTGNGHIHKMDGTLELNIQHEHPYCNYTFEDVEYTSQRMGKQALI